MVNEKTFSEAQEQILEFVKQGQQSAVAAVKTWADTVQATVPTVFDKLPTEVSTERVNKAVDDTYELAQRVLTAQREFVKGLVDATEPAVKAVRESLEKVRA